MVHQHIPEEKLIDYILGQLSSKEHFKINAHLTVCSTCRNEHTTWEKYLNVETKPVPSPHLKQKIWTELDIKRKKLNVKWVYATVSLCAAFLILFSFFHTPKQENVSNHGAVVHITPQNNDLFGIQTADPVNIELLNLPSNFMENDEVLVMDVKDFNQIYVNLFSTQSVYNPSRITMLGHNNEGQIYFSIDHSICSYTIEDTQIYCVQMAIIE